MRQQLLKKTAERAQKRVNDLKSNKKKQKRQKHA
jgi:hypothetical protein